MLVYKELSLGGSKSDLDEFKENAHKFSTDDWKYVSGNNRMKDYILFDYKGSNLQWAEVSIYYGSETWRDCKIKVGNIVPLRKDQLTVQEYNALLDSFYECIILPFHNEYPALEVVGPTSEKFDPLHYISKTALEKLECFCNAANKSTGSSHPSDEERWFDFICQTVDDRQVFGYDTIYKFLMDEDYWGKKESGFIGVMGNFAWDEEHAGQLALEYDNYVRILQFYKERKRRAGQ